MRAQETEEDLRIELRDLKEVQKAPEADEDFEIVLSDWRRRVDYNLDITLGDSNVDDFATDLDISDTDLALARRQQDELDQAARVTVENWSEDADAIAAELAEPDEAEAQQEPAKELAEPQVVEVQQIEDVGESEDEKAVVGEQSPEARVDESVEAGEPEQDQAEAEREEVLETSNITREAISEEIDACQMTINRVRTINDSYESQGHYLREAFNRGEKLNTYADHLYRYDRLLKQINDALIGGRGTEVINLEQPLNAEKNHLEDAQDSLIRLTYAIESSPEADYRDREVAVTLRYAVTQAQEVNRRRY